LRAEESYPRLSKVQRRVGQFEKCSRGNNRRIVLMTLQELEHIEPDLVGQIRHDAAHQERERLLTLSRMNGPGLELIIDRAVKDGSDPSAIAIECLGVVKQQKDTGIVTSPRSLADVIRKDPEQQRRKHYHG
jgi:hypothetical protein